MRVQVPSWPSISLGAKTTDTSFNPQVRGSIPLTLAKECSSVAEQRTQDTDVVLFSKLLKLNIQVRRLAVTSKICYKEAEVTGSSPVRCTRRYPDSEV